jgi:hypothetical protein
MVPDEGTPVGDGANRGWCSVNRSRRGSFLPAAGLWKVLDSTGWTATWGYRIDTDKGAINDGSFHLRHIRDVNRVDRTDRV